MLGLPPEPVLGPTWRAFVDSHRNVRGILFEHADANVTAVDRLGQRAEPPSADAKTNEYSSHSGKKLSLPAPISAAEAKMLFGSDAPSEELSGQDVHSDKACLRFGARQGYPDDRIPNVMISRNRNPPRMAVRVARPLLRPVFWGGTLGRLIRLSTKGFRLPRLHDKGLASMC